MMRKIFGSKIKHILLLHENDLAGLFLSDLIKFLRLKKWNIISIKDAYNDYLIKKEMLNIHNFESLFRNKSFKLGIQNQQLYPKDMIESNIKDKFKKMKIVED